MVVRTFPLGLVSLRSQGDVLYRRSEVSVVEETVTGRTLGECS